MLADQVGVRKQRGATVFYVVREDKVVGALSLEDTVRPESRQAVEELHRLGKRVVMITGDARQVAEAVAAELGGRRGVRRGPTQGQGSGRGRRSRGSTRCSPRSYPRTRIRP